MGNDSDASSTSPSGWRSGYWSGTSSFTSSDPGSGTMLVSQAGVQSIIVTTLVAQPGVALSRWLDAVVGGSVALLAATITPATPLRRPRAQAAVVVVELSAILACPADALRQNDKDLVTSALARARNSEHALDELRARANALVTRSLSFCRRASAVQARIADSSTTTTAAWARGLRTGEAGVIVAARSATLPPTTASSQRLRANPGCATNVVTMID